MQHIKKMLMSAAFLIQAFLLCACGRSGAVIITESAVITEAGSDDTTVTDISVDGDSASHGLENEQVAIHVCGAVEQPGVYYLSAGSINQDAVNMAGGFTDGAATDYVNLAEKIEAGGKLYIPYEEDLVNDTIGSQETDMTAGDSSVKVNINTASKEELMTLTGIGEGKACAIITYRDEHGDFKCIEDIMQVPGIKEATYESIRDSIAAY